MHCRNYLQVFDNTPYFVHENSLSERLRQNQPSFEFSKFFQLIHFPKGYFVFH
jgi:hypothetical protein